MVQASGRERIMQKTKSFHFRKMFEIQKRHSQCLNFDQGDDGAMNSNDSCILDEKMHLKKCMSKVGHLDAGSKSPREHAPSDVEMMKEKFAKLLLGEDMSGGGKGVSSALALSNAITNLAASVFGEQKRLEPMSLETKTRWRKEIDWLLSVADHIIELVPSQQSKDGINMEIMTTRQRSDLLMSIPALRKLDAILIDELDRFGHQNEFWYVSKDSNNSEQGTPPRNDEKWWIPTVKVPPQGLSEATRKCLQWQKESVSQVLKAAMAINAQVLSDMKVPENYIESLPKNGKTSLGDSIYKSITVDYFDPEQFLSTMDLSTELKVLDLKNRIEASIVIWKRKMQKDGKSSWSSGVSLEKRELFEERAETILFILKQRFPGIPQSTLDISKIQYNKDVGQAILESYSRIIESLAFNVLSRIEDVLYADSLTKNAKRELNDDSKNDDNVCNWGDDETPTSLSGFRRWNSKKYHPESIFKGDHEKKTLKPMMTMKKFSYLEKLENLSGLRSPTARH